MPRQRFIWPGIWSDPVLGRLPEPQLLLYIACFSLADDEGRLLGDPAWLNAQAFPYRSYSATRVKEMRDAIAAVSHSFLVYTVDGIDYVAFANWLDFQRPKYPKASTLPHPEDAKRPRRPSRHGEIMLPGDARQWVRRGYIKKHVRAAVYARDNHACQLCGSGSSLQIDHIEPVSRGGSNEPDNLRTLCRSCNSRKRDHTDKREETFLQKRETIPESGETIPDSGSLGREGKDPPNPPKGGLRLGVKELRQYTGCREAHGSHGVSYVPDVLGRAKPPPSWPHEKPSREQILAALTTSANGTAT